MKDKHRAKKKPVAHRRQERRYTAEPGYASRFATTVGMVGSLVLGAGVWGQWIRDEPSAYAIYLVALGGASLIASLWLSSRGPSPIRVGDAGIALEHGADLQRIAWYQVQRISMKGDALAIERAAGQPSAEMVLPLEAHPRAIAKIVQEAALRIPARLELSPGQHQRLPKTAEHDGELMHIDSLQIAGQKCLHCEQVITLERDARLCPACGAAYLNNHVPAECKACGGALGARAVRA